MPILLVTNDFPPALGGIQSYLRDYVSEVIARRGPEEVVVFASTQNEAEAAAFDATQPYKVVRWPQKVMLPTRRVRDEMARLISAHGITTVWFGAAAPLAVMGAAAKRAGATKVVATTHGHEVGWSMVPGARQSLAKVGRGADIVTYISRYTLRRLRGAVGAHPEYVALPSGVDTQFFRPATPDQKAATRNTLGIGPKTPLIVCSSRLVPRKGQDQLIRALPGIRRKAPGTVLVLVGSGRYERKLRRLAGEGVIFTGAVSREELRDIVAAADVFAMPARTRGGGLDVEGLGIVYLEAQACAVPVVAGRSGGAPETVTGDTGVVVDGRDVGAIEDAIGHLLIDEPLRTRMGIAGRKHVSTHFSWETLGDRCAELLQ